MEMTQDEVTQLFHQAGEAAGWKPGVGNALVINYLTHFAELVEKRVLLRQTIASTAGVVGTEQLAGRTARLAAFMKELDAKEVWHQSGRLEPGEPMPEPLRLADELENAAGDYFAFHKKLGYGASAELRRLSQVETEYRERILRLEAALARAIAKVEGGAT